MSDNEGRGIDRRVFIGVAGAAAASGLAASRWATEQQNNAEARPNHEGERIQENGFQNHIEGYRTLYGELTRNEILFLKPDGSPLEKVRLEPYGDIPPGEFDANGFISEESGLNQEWLDAHRQRICAAYPELGFRYVEGSEPRQLNSIPMLRRAVIDYGIGDELGAEDRETFLNTMTFMDIVRHFGAQPDHQDLGIGREAPLAHVRSHILDWATDFSEDERERLMPIWEELPFVIPALAAQESQYNNEARSHVGAEGIFQFMPGTWEHLGFDREDLKSLRKQLHGVHKHLLGSYEYLRGRIPAALELIKTRFFQGEEGDTAFRKNFLLPVLINCYNAGDGNLEKVITWFTDTRMPTLPEGAAFLGRDLYHFMAHEAAASTDRKLADYKRDSSQYVERIFALSTLVADL